jgi:hypothetical protein
MSSDMAVSSDLAVSVSNGSSANTPLFVNVASKTAILLVDRSGSTRDHIDLRNRITVFDKMCITCNELPHDSFYVVFWSSPDYNTTAFKDGVHVVPFKVSKGPALTTVFNKIATENSGSGTCPGLGFSGIKPEWLAEDPMVYLLTDGQIGCSPSAMTMERNKQLLVNEIMNLNTQFSIIAVETTERKFSDVESVNNAAGGDIYNIVVEYKLTGKLSKFMSVNPLGRFMQIDKIKPLSGHVPYGHQCFDMKRVSEFIQYIRDDIGNNPTEEHQIEVAQKLSATLEVLTRDKPRRLASDIIRTFASLFTIDKTIINYLMVDAVDKERAGAAQIVANYRNNLKNLFAQAANALKMDVSSAIGLDDCDLFVSPVINGNIIVGQTRNIDKTVNIWSDSYKRAGWRSNIPVLPMLDRNFDYTRNRLRDQCMRQWIRCIYAELYDLPAMSDQIIYLVICDMVRVWKLTKDDAECKVAVMDAYREFARCMLRKGRLNTNRTELDVLLEGNAPTTNSGSYDEFVKMFKHCMELTGLSGAASTSANDQNVFTDWGSCWYEACTILSLELAAKQKKHCGDLSAQHANTPRTISIYKESESSMYDYNCLITLDDISAVGGYKILGHRFGNSTCSPMYLLSADGMRNLLNANSTCPVCYSRLIERDFQHIGPKVVDNDNLDNKFESGKFTGKNAKLSDQFASMSVGESSGSGSSAPNGQKNKRYNKSRSGNPIRNANGKIGTLVIMKGTVGAGKTTYSAFIKRAVEARGGVCYVEGTDKYCVKGDHMRTAVAKVATSLSQISACDNDDIVVVIDTCGEQSNGAIMFNTDFSGWKVAAVWPNLNRSDIRGYLAWSYRNVLRRVRTDVNSPYWLNPVETSVELCKSVHLKKVKALQLVKKNDIINYNDLTMLDRDANAYEAAYIRPFEMPNGV